MAVSSHPFIDPKAPKQYPAPLDRSASGFEVVKVRILLKLQDRIDLAAARRMPPALFQQTARQQIEHVIDAEAPRLSPTERARLIEGVYREGFGYGPLEELFSDSSVNEIIVLGPNAVVVRRDQSWVPTNVKFRDGDQIREVLERAVLLGEPVSPGLSKCVLDAKLPNGFRVVAVLPPPLLDQPGTATFVRVEVLSQIVQSEASHSSTAAPTPPFAPRLPGASISGVTTTPAPGETLLARHRLRITERIVSKMAKLGVYDASRLDVAELRKIVTAYIEEYCQTEKVLLSDVEQGRMMLEILAAMRR